ncbi:MAG: hypothetical protein Q8O66_02335 [bacterium]|nr:hypothetical protein [bacterium]
MTDILENLLPEQSVLNERIFNLILGRVFKIVYLNLDENNRKEMERVFVSDDDNEKEKFIKKYVFGFETIFKEEAKKFEEKIKIEIENQI